MQRQIACYGAALAIILDQITGHPSATMAESPNPLVRVQERDRSLGEWHPDELVERSGINYVLVWEHAGVPGQQTSSRMLSN